MGDVSSPLRPSPPELEKSGLTMLFYGIFIVGIAAIVFTTYNFILIRWCANNHHPLPTRTPARRGDAPRPATVAAAASEDVLISVNRKKIGLLTSSFKYKKSAPEDQAAGRRGSKEGGGGGGGDEGNDIHICNADDDEEEEGCAVCLSSFEHGEELRQLPNCSHTFHAPCIDMWLVSHLDCPLCRTPLDFTCLLAAPDRGETRIQVS